MRALTLPASPGWRLWLAPLAVALLGLLGLTALAGCAPGASHTSGATPTATPSLVSRPLPQYADDALHFTRLLYQLQAGASSMVANGVIIHVDVWETLGKSGTPTLVSARYTWPDGSLYQQVYLSQTANVTVLGAFYTPPGAAPCQHTGSPPTPRQLAAQLPRFTPLPIVGGAGFTRSSGTPSQTLPTTPALPGVTPLTTLASPATVTILTGTVSTAAGIDHARDE